MRRPLHGVRERTPDLLEPLGHRPDRIEPCGALKQKPERTEPLPVESALASTRSENRVPLRGSRAALELVAAEVTRPLRRGESRCAASSWKRFSRNVLPVGPRQLPETGAPRLAMCNAERAGASCRAATSP